LWACSSLLREYEILFENRNIFNRIYYCLTLNTFLWNKINSDKLKWNILKKIFVEKNIKILYGEDINYFVLLVDLFNKSFTNN